MTVEHEPAYQVVPLDATGGAYVQIKVPGLDYSAIRVPLPEDPVQAAAWIDRALRAAAYMARKHAEAFPDAPAERPQERTSGHGRAQGPARSPQPQNRQRGGSGGQRGTSRAERFERWDGEECDICGGPVGVYPKTGKMRTDKLVCLGTCKDEEYVHTVRFLNDEDEAPF